MPLYQRIAYNVINLPTTSQNTFILEIFLQTNAPWMIPSRPTFSPPLLLSIGPTTISDVNRCPPKVPLPQDNIKEKYFYFFLCLGSIPSGERSTSLKKCLLNEYIWKLFLSWGKNCISNPLLKITRKVKAFGVVEETPVFSDFQTSYMITVSRPIS